MSYFGLMVFGILLGLGDAKALQLVFNWFAVPAFPFLRPLSYGLAWGIGLIVAILQSGITAGHRFTKEHEAKPVSRKAMERFSISFAVWVTVGLGWLWKTLVL